MTSTTFTWKQLIPFAWLGDTIAGWFSRLALRVMRSRGDAGGRSTHTCTAPAQSESSQDEKDSLAQVIAHLEYLGYEVDPPEPDGWSFARHPLRYDFHLRTVPSGIRLHCAVQTDVAEGKSRAEWLDYLNTSNARSRITHFSLFEDRYGMYGVRMSAFASGSYSRRTFAIVMDMWHDDVDRIRRKPDFLPTTSATAGQETPAVTVH